MPNYLNKIVYLTEAQKETLFSTGSVTANGQIITYNANDLYFTTDGALPVSGGGTGANSASGAIQNLMGSTAIGDSSTPIYWDGSGFVQVNNITEEVAATLNIPEVDIDSSKWFSKTWTGLTDFNGSDVWSDGKNIYYSYDTTHYVLDQSTSTWSVKTWTGLTNFRGSYIWSDGDNIYYSNNTTQYVLDKSTSTWRVKTWFGVRTTIMGYSVWSDGDNIYAVDYEGYDIVLDKSTSTWFMIRDWGDAGGYGGRSIWSDGENIYLSVMYDDYVFDKSTSTWSEKTWNWNGIPVAFRSGVYIWTDEKDVYFSYNQHQYVLDKSTSTWNPKTWNISGLQGLGLQGNYIWNIGNTFYYSYYDANNSISDQFSYESGVSYITVTDNDGTEALDINQNTLSLSGDSIVQGEKDVTEEVAKVLSASNKSMQIEKSYTATSWSWGDESAIADETWFEGLSKQAAPDSNWVGKTKKVTLTSAVLGTTTHLIQCIGINQDGENTVTFQTKNGLVSATAFGANNALWSDGDCTARKQCQNYYNAFPGKDYIKKLTKVTNLNYTSSSTNMGTTEDYVWLLSYDEVGEIGSYAPGGDEFTQGSTLTIPYNYYTDSSSRVKKQGDSGSVSNWWLRSRCTIGANHVGFIGNNGGMDGASYNATCCLAPAFAIQLTHGYVLKQDGEDVTEEVAKALSVPDKSIQIEKSYSATSWSWGDESSTADETWFEGLSKQAPSEDWVGKTKKVTLTSSVLGTTTHLIQCIGINQDGQNTVTFQTKNCLANTAAFGSYKLWYDNTCTARDECNNYYNAFPGKNYIKQLVKITGGPFSGDTTETADYVWLPSGYEVGIRDEWYNTGIYECTKGQNNRYSYYSNESTRVKQQGDQGSNVSWWLRGFYMGHVNHGVEVISTTGSLGGINYSTTTIGFAPAFAIQCTPEYALYQNGEDVTSDVASALDLDKKQDILTFDQTPTENSGNPVTSGGVFNALEAIPRPNLLKNAYFVGGGSQLGDGVFPINSRGQTSYSGYVECIDKWINFSAGTTTNLLSSGLSVAATVNGGCFAQRIPYDQEFSKQKIIVSFLTTSGQLLSAVFNPIDTSKDWQGLLGFLYNEITGFYADIEYNQGAIGITLCKDFDDTTRTVVLAAAKLELGETQTLAHQDGNGNWVLNEIPNYYEELTRCALPTGIIISTSAPTASDGYNGAIWFTYTP